MENLTQDSLDQFQQSLVRMGVSPHTCKGYVSDLKQFRTWKSSDIPGDEFLNLARDWLNEAANAGASSATLNRRRASLNKFAKFANGPRLTAELWIAPKADDPKPHPLPGGMADVDKMLKATYQGSPVWYLVALCGKLGLRVSEALKAEIKDFNPGAETLTVHGKGKRSRVIPVHWQPLKAELHFKASLWMGPAKVIDLPDSTARRLITKLGERARISRRVASHDLRATFATHVYRQTHDIRAVQILLGHQSVTTTQRYVGVDMDTLRSVMPS